MEPAFPGPRPRQSGKRGGTATKKAQKSQNSFRSLVFLCLFCGYFLLPSHFTLLVTSKVFRTIGCDVVSAPVFAVVICVVRFSRVAARSSSNFLIPGS